MTERDGGKNAGLRQNKRIESTILVLHSKPEGSIRFC